MNKIAIQLLPPTENGRLYYQRDPSTENSLIYIRRHLVERAAYVINIDGVISIALDNDSKIQSIECVWSRKAWKVRDNIRPPEEKTPADVKISGISKGIFLSLPVTVLTDLNYEFVQVIIGTPEPHLDWVSLSDQCFILVSGAHLRGYYVRLT